MIPKVCVGVPVYNEADYIENTLLSLKRQNFDDVHFIVSDNASSDGTWEICQAIAADDKRFLLHKNAENVGALNNFEQVFRNSDSDYFMWLGGHDYISENYIEKAANMLDVDMNLSLVCGMPTMIKSGHQDKLLDTAIYKYSEKRLGRYLQCVRELYDCTIVHSLFRRPAMDGFTFRATTGPDMVMIARMLWHGQLAYMSGENYFRRYFDTRPGSYEERIVGRPCNLSYYDLLRYYLDDFSLLYNGDVRMKSYLENEIIATFSKKFGIHRLLPNDGV